MDLLKSGLKVIASYLKQNIFILPILLVLAISYKPGEIIMGLDNASPYFGLHYLTERIHGIGIIVFGGNLFSAIPLSLLGEIGLSPSALSYIYHYFSFFSGVFFLTLTLNSLIIDTKKDPEDRGDTFIKPLISLFIISNLAVVWLFSQPIFSFIAGFGSLFALIYAMNFMRNGLSRYIMILAYTLLLLTSSVNLVTFVSLLFQINLLSIFIGVYLSDKEYLAAVKSYSKSSLLYSVFPIIILIIFYLSIALIRGESLVDQYKLYINNLQNNTFSSEATNDLIASEMQNYLANSVRYATGWTGLQSTSNEPLFSNYTLYNSPPFILLGLLPLLLIGSLLFLNLKFKFLTSREVRRATILFVGVLITVLLFSRYVLIVYQEIPYIRDLLRWPSSKLWPSYLFFITGLFAYTILVISEQLDKLQNKILLRIKNSSNGYVGKVGNSIKLNQLFFIFIFALLITYAYPNYKSGIFSDEVQNRLPDQYSELNHYLESGNNIFVMPAPQVGYFRELEWGYYGADFLKYLSDGDFYDASNVVELEFEYYEYLSSINSCESAALREMDFILIYKDQAGVEGEIPNCLQNDTYETVVDNKNFMLLKLLN